jgi:hypothetical protein
MFKCLLNYLLNGLTPRLWVPSCRYLQPLPATRPSKTGIAAVKRRARKARNRRRQHGHA